MARASCSATLVLVRNRFCLILLIAGGAIAQDATQKKDPPPPPKKEEPAPLFGGKLGVRSSQKTKESATLGFNGLDPSGKVDQKMLATAATAEDQAKVRKMAEESPAAADLAAFIQ